MLVRLAGRCGGDPRELHWTANGEPAAVVRTAKEGDSRLVLLSVGDLEDATLTLTANRPEADGPSWPLPTQRRVRPAAPSNPGASRSRINRLSPTNRDAGVHVAPVGNQAHLVPLPEEGAYRVTTDAGGSRVRGENGVGGFVSLRFGYRVDGLPPRSPRRTSPS